MSDLVKSRPFSIKIFLTLISITAALLVIHLFLQYINLLVYEEQNGALFELSNRFDMDDEISAPTWFSQFLLLLVATVAGLAAWLDRLKSVRKFWWAIALIGLLASIDEGAAIHEFTLQTIHNFAYGDTSQSLLTNAWLVVLPLLATLGFLLARWGWRVLPKKTFWLFMAGGAAFMIGAVFFDWLISDVDPAAYLSQGILVALEETFEMIGTAIVIYAIIDYLESEHKTKINQAIRSLR